MSLRTLAITLCLLIVPEISLAGISFTDEEAKRLVIEIQEGRQAIAENKLMKEEITAYMEIIQAKDDALKEYAILLKDSQDACEGLVGGGSSILSGFFGIIGGIGLGLLIGLAL